MSSFICSSVHLLYFIIFHIFTWYFIRRKGERENEKRQSFAKFSKNCNDEWQCISKLGIGTSNQGGAYKIKGCYMIGLFFFFFIFSSRLSSLSDEMSRTAATEIECSWLWLTRKTEQKYHHDRNIRITMGTDPINQIWTLLKNVFIYLYHFWKFAI